MKTGTRRTSATLSFVVGLLVLAGACFEGRPVSAQTPVLIQEQEACPLPDGVMPPADPPVTAQQVKDGSATLAEFAQVALSHFSGGTDVLTTQQLAYSGCRLRLEGGPWYSGSTYIVTLTPDGRVYLHSKNMSLSAGQLQSQIYAQILLALGTPAAVLQGLRSMDDAARERARALLIAHLGSEPHGPFNLTGGESGYAGAYVSVNTGQPFVLLVGFDLNASHLADEDIDYGDPAITASEVVDRATLKMFVTEALRFIAGKVRGAGSTAESRVAFQQARLALRDPDGPWIDGSVYIHIVDGESNLILFHGGFPDRLELRRGGINRDIATGELVFDQLVDAARSDPGGGFWLYYFDNPADDTDSAQVPKVGYAREFVRTTMTADGSEVRTNLIIASGFYLTSDGVFVQRILEALEEAETSMMFAITTPEDGDIVDGDAVEVSVTGAPTDTVHFAYRLAGLPDEAYTYLGAATNREGVASFTWDIMDLRDDDYELVALYTEDEGHTVTSDTIEVNVDNVGDGGCVAVPVLPGGGGPLDPTLPALVGLMLAYLTFGRRYLMRQAVLR